MKSFDLEAAKAGAPIQSRNGLSAKFISYVPEAGKHERVIAFIPGFGIVTRHENGASSVRADYDLVMAPQKVMRYVSFFPDGIAYWSETRMVAKMACDGSSATHVSVPVEIEI